MIQRFDVGSRMSEMAVHRGTEYLAGQVADDATQDIAGQTRQVLAAVDAWVAPGHSPPRATVQALWPSRVGRLKWW